MRRDSNHLLLMLSVLTLILCSGTACWAILLNPSGAPDPADPLLYAWYDGNEAIGADGSAETPIWPNKQGDEFRGITSGFGGDAAELNLIEDALNGNNALEYVDLVTWAEAGDWGELPQPFTAFAVANIQDPGKAFLFQGNQGGNQGAGAWANFSLPGDEVWEMFAGDVVDTGVLETDSWLMHTFVFDGPDSAHYISGELQGTGDAGESSLNGLVLGGRQNGFQRSTALHGEYLFYEDVLSESDRQLIEGYLNKKWFGVGGVSLQAGDADMDCDFDQFDLVQVQVAAKYLTGEPATWGEGDWDGAPGGSVEDKNPPPGNGLFDQLDIIAALSAGTYLQGAYCAEVGLNAMAMPVPEPSTLVLLGLGFTTMMFMIRRR